MDKQLFIEESGLTFKVEGLSPSLKEAVDKTGHLVLKGVPASVIDELNGNDRKYTKKEINKSIKKLRESGVFKARKLLCSADDHPKESYVAPASASHVILDAYTKKLGEEGKEKTYLMNDWLLLNTSSGKNLKALVEAGASFGTSIRGLGQLNEETKEVENYEMLGCDAVGNPSAGTYASKEQFKVVAEAVTGTLSSLTEKSKDKEMSFDLQEKIAEFKTKYFKEGKAPEKVTKEVTADLLAIQREAVENAMDTSDLEALSNEIFGEPSTPEEKKSKGTHPEESKDILNKTLRELEATQNLAVYLRDQVTELETAKDTMQKEIEAYEQVAVTLYEQVEDLAEEGEASRDSEVKTLTRKFVSTVRRLQKEAHDVIRSLETRFESAIRIGDSAIDHAVTLRRIADSLYVRSVKQIDESDSAFVKSKSAIARMTSRRESVAKQVIGGDRAGWR
jgi:Prohead core protein serine protease